MSGVFILFILIFLVNVFIFGGIIFAIIKFIKRSVNFAKNRIESRETERKEERELEFLKLKKQNKKCEYCGKLIGENEKECSSCGAAVTEDKS